MPGATVDASTAAVVAGRVFRRGECFFLADPARFMGRLRL